MLFLYQEESYCFYVSETASCRFLAYRAQKLSKYEIYMLEEQGVCGKGSCCKGMRQENEKIYPRQENGKGKKREKGWIYPCECGGKFRDWVREVETGNFTHKKQE